MDRLGDCIAPQVARLRDDFRLTPVTASEIEFYLLGSATLPSLREFWEETQSVCAAAGMHIFHIDREKGREQHEVALAPCADPGKAARDTQSLKNILASLAARYGMTADFSARPFADQPGSGLHVHVHLEGDGRNVFFKNDDSISDPLKHAIGGLVAWLPDSMAIFAPHASSYARFTAGSNAPTHVSWGANNRTVAIRLPMAAHNKKRIEHRVAGADADPAKVIAVILAAMHYGLKNACEPGPQMYGDAALPQYALPPLPQSLPEAQARLSVSQLLSSYFSASMLLPDR